jgi:hypothetical protein
MAIVPVTAVTAKLVPVPVPVPVAAGLEKPTPVMVTGVAVFSGPVVGAILVISGAAASVSGSPISASAD